MGLTQELSKSNQMLADPSMDLQDGFVPLSAAFAPMFQTMSQTMQREHERKIAKMQADSAEQSSSGAEWAGPAMLGTALIGDQFGGGGEAAKTATGGAGGMMPMMPMGGV